MMIYETSKAMDIHEQTEVPKLARPVQSLYSATYHVFEVYCRGFYLPHDLQA